jgi:hypothetical protein
MNVFSVETIFSSELLKRTINVKFEICSKAKRAF